MTSNLCVGITDGPFRPEKALYNLVWFIKCAQLASINFSFETNLQSSSWYEITRFQKIMKGMSKTVYAVDLSYFKLSWIAWLIVPCQKVIGTVCVVMGMLAIRNYNKLDTWEGHWWSFCTILYPAVSKLRCPDWCKPSSPIKLATMRHFGSFVEKADIKFPISSDRIGKHSEP